jgi:hypothetical protein
MKCSRILEDGSSCGAESLTDSTHCVAHDDRPQTVQRRREWSSRGGRAAHAPQGAVDVPVDFSSAEALLATLERATEALIAGTLDRGRMNAVAYACTSATQVRKQLHLEQRLRVVERRLGLREEPLEDDETEDDHGEV